MPLYWKRKVLTAKSEGTYGTDSTPAVASDAILARNMRLSPLEMETEERGNELNYVGHQGEIIAGSYVKLDFEVELAGAGSAGTASPIAALLKACGMSQTLNAATSAVYALVAPGSETSCSIYFFMGGRRHKLLGALGTYELEWVKGRVPLIKFSFTGLYAAVADAALAAPTLTGFQKPVAVTNANTVISLHSFAGKFREFRFSLGAQVDYRNLAGSEAVRLTDRKVTGRVVLEDELVATKDWWTIMRAGTLGAFSVAHGTAAGNIVTAAGSNVQLVQPSIDQDQNISMLTMNMLFTPSSSGNDEFNLTLT